jgi:endogenous inhibitor of DNA gyrase (YacG/DUF329 family)
MHPWLTATCASCGKTFQWQPHPSHPLRRYCSRECGAWPLTDEVKTANSERLRLWHQNATPEQKAESERKRQAARKASRLKRQSQLANGVKAQVVALREKHPNWWAREIAEMVGVSRQLVLYILQGAGLLTRRQSLTRECAKEGCSNRFRKHSTRTYCSRECREAARAARSDIAVLCKNEGSKS